MSLHVRKASFPSSRPAFSHPAFDVECRAVQADLATGATVASVYVPNGGKDYPAKVKFMEGLVAWVAEVCASGKQLVLCGDLNVAREEIDVHPSQRDAKAIGQLPEERLLFATMLAHGLVDVGRALAPDDERLFTWWPYWRQARERNLGGRIDYVLASKGLAARATECAIRKDVGTSDHAPLVAVFGDAP